MPLRTIPTQAIDPFFMYEEGFRKVHIAAQQMGNVCIALCGSSSPDPGIPDNPNFITPGIICATCRKMLTVTLDKVVYNTQKLVTTSQTAEAMANFAKPRDKNVFFYNFVGHAITILDHNGDRLIGLRVDEKGRKAILRSNYKTRKGEFVRGTATNIMVKTMFHEAILEYPNQDSEPFPEPKDGVIFIVPGHTLRALQDAGRTDVFAPGPVARNAAGAIVGCWGLARYEEEK